MKPLERIINGLDADALSDLTGYLLSFVNSDRVARIDHILDRRTRYIVLVLENIYHPYNASAVIRSCECFGVQHIHAVESSNTFVANRAIVQGADKWVTLHRYGDGDGTRTCLRGLKDSGYRIVAMTPDPNSVPIGKLDIDSPLALCLGSEEPGLTEVALEMADIHARIPMQGFTQSLNLSVSAGIAVEQLSARIRESSRDWHLDPEERGLLRCLWLARSISAGSRIVKRYLEERHHE